MSAVVSLQLRVLRSIQLLKSTRINEGEAAVRVQKREALNKGLP